MLAIIHPLGETPRLALVGVGSTNIEGGTSERLVVRLTKIGAQHLRLRGRFAGRLHVKMVVQTVPHSPNPDAVVTYVRAQGVSAPPIIVTADTRLRRISLAPGQRLVLRLRGESASTGYAWRFAPLGSDAALRRVSTRSITSPSCTVGMVGCASIRQVVYEARRYGVTPLAASLHGPGTPSSATMNLSLAVTTSGRLATLPAVFAAKHNGSSFSPASGYITVRLSGASASTGYEWRPIIGDSSRMKPFLHQEFLNECPVGSTSCGQVDEFSYQTSVLGETLKLGLYAPGSVVPVEEFTLNQNPTAVD